MNWLNRSRRWGIGLGLTGTALMAYGAFIHDQLGNQLGTALLSLALCLLLFGKLERP